jgi:4-hydroxy-tetrahydrodipicolinate synthase
MFKEMYDSVRRGDLKNAERLQFETDELASIYQKDRTLGQSLAAAKVIMKYFDICEPHMLFPLARLTYEEEKLIIKNIEQLKKRIRIY